MPLGGGGRYVVDFLYSENTQALKTTLNHQAALKLVYESGQELIPYGVALVIACIIADNLHYIRYFFNAEKFNQISVSPIQNSFTVVIDNTGSVRGSGEITFRNESEDKIKIYGVTIVKRGSVQFRIIADLYDISKSGVNFPINSQHPRSIQPKADLVLSVQWVEPPKYFYKSCERTKNIFVRYIFGCNQWQGFILLIGSAGKNFPPKAVTTDLIRE